MTSDGAAFRACTETGESSLAQNRRVDILASSAIVVAVNTIGTCREYCSLPDVPPMSRFTSYNKPD